MVRNSRVMIGRLVDGMTDDRPTDAGPRALTAKFPVTNGSCVVTTRMYVRPD